MARARLAVESAARSTGEDPNGAAVGGQCPTHRIGGSCAGPWGRTKSSSGPDQVASRLGSAATAELLAADASRSDLDARRWRDLFDDASRQIFLRGGTCTSCGNNILGSWTS